MRAKNQQKNLTSNMIIISAIIFFLIVGLWMWGMPKYRVYQLELHGKAQLAQAEWSKQIAIKEANAKKDSAILLAEAEIERSKGVAEANKIIGESLKENEEYLRYLWIDGISSKDQQLVYVPTEAGLPILEAGRLK